MPLAPGTKLGPYEIIAPLGEGGMGEVYKARDTRLDRTVALKISKSEFTERFDREARAVAALNHPNICQLYDVGPNYLVMELIEGAPLKGPLPIAQAVEYAKQILDALDAAHRKGITHRDLKPANILVTKQGIKLLDFGLAKHNPPLQQTDATLTKGLTGDGQILGTLQYMAPEQLQGKPADARSDIFSFGCVLYEIIGGKKAFHGASSSVIAAIIERDPAPLEIDKPLDRVIRKCLAKDPDDRFQTARDLKYNLSLALEPHQTQKSANWPWTAIAIAAATTLIIGAIGGTLFTRQTPARSTAIRFQLQPPEGGRFSQIGAPALSPDGRTVAFSAMAQGKSGLWLRSLDGTAARYLPGTASALSSIWSPDGRSIAYSTGGALMRVELDGGTPVTIYSATASLGFWTTDGRIVISLFGAPFLRSIPASGGQPQPFTQLDANRGERSHTEPQLLPGGRLLFPISADQPENWGVFASSLTNPSERIRLLPGAAYAFYAAGYLL